MNQTWQFPVTFRGKSYYIVAELFYESSQVMRFNVHGKRSTVVLETNYPITRCRGSKPAIKWKFLSGSFGQPSPETARLVFDVFKELEYILKDQYPKQL